VLSDIFRCAYPGIVVASIVRYSEYYLFVIPNRYIGVDENEIPFHGIGGKVNNNENFLDAIIREVKEEVNLDIDISDSPETSYHTSAAHLSSISLSDTPRPYCIYKRTRQGDINFSDADTLWIIGYTGRLDETQVKLENLSPHAEVGAIVILTAKTLIKTLDSDFTYNDIKKAGDGSQVIHRASTNFNYSAKAVPAGLASICAAELGRRSSAAELGRRSSLS
jgi:hypothetical protein